jgi:hypothetical protein
MMERRPNTNLPFGALALGTILEPAPSNREFQWSVERRGDFSPLLSLILWSKCQQDISGHPAKARVAGIDVTHAIHDYGACSKNTNLQVKNYR